MRTGLSRRRFLGITAAAAAGLPLGLRAADAPLHVWNGTALGARASIRLYHPDRALAERLIAACRNEIGRLERVFSLYRPDSAVSRLNAAGRLEAPPLDLVRLLDESRRLHRLTGGAFDVTVQPLWLAYARHFRESETDTSGPAREVIENALARVGQEKLAVEPHLVAFARTGMGVTLNGIAQGYLTDRVTELLRDEGLENVLVDLGEARASGEHGDGRPWRAAIADPLSGGADLRLELRDRALATSAPGGFMFDAEGRFNHLFDPRTGISSSRYASVSVLAEQATTADALSTAFALMSEAEIERAAREHGAVTVHLLHADGRWEEIAGSPA